MGQPPYDPADLLKLYLYGYINQIRSSRRLEGEAGRNLELIWLLKNLRPGYRTIAKFRKENWAALKAVNRSFVLLMRELGLVGGSLVAIDGSFFHGDASKASIFTRKRLTDQIAKLDQEIEAYGKSVEDNDAAEARKPGKDATRWRWRRSRWRRHRRKGRGADGPAFAFAEADLDRLAEIGETQLSLTDPDARLLVKSGQGVAGYNVQIAVDDKHKLIVASEVVNDSSDVNQLYAMARAAKEVLGVEALQVVADEGYYSSATLKACEDDGIEAYVPPSDGNRRLENEGRFSLKSFSYDAAGGCLHLSGRRTAAGDGRTPAEPKRPARNPLCEQQEDLRDLRTEGHIVCLRRQSPVISRWEHEDVLDRHRARMESAGELMRRRSGIVEHPFGTLKCRAGYRHFLVRGFNKVRGEWSLMALCYNFIRVLNILGFERFLAAVAKALSLHQQILKAAMDVLQRALKPFRACLVAKLSICLANSALTRLIAVLAQPRRAKLFRRVAQSIHAGCRRLLCMGLFSIF